MCITEIPPQSTACSILVVSGITGAACGVYLSRLANRLANHNLGFFGERLVGEALSALQAERCRVFHDIPMDGPANLDHVLVTPPAVFAIETKMRRRKRVHTSGQPTHRVRYDGERIHPPFGSDTHGLNQARRNARWLSKFLTKANAAEVPVTAVLVLPQWEMHRVARGDFTVVSHKELKALAGFTRKNSGVWPQPNWSASTSRFPSGRCVTGFDGEEEDRFFWAALIIDA